MDPEPAACQLDEGPDLCGLGVPSQCLQHIAELQCRDLTQRREALGMVQGAPVDGYGVGRTVVPREDAPANSSELPAAP